MNTKITQVRKVKEKFKSNQQFIQNLGISEIEYKNLILDVGCEFLEERYPLNEEVYYSWYQEFAFSKSFWQWWILEWNNWLAYLIQKGTLELSIAFPYSMRLLNTREETHTAFQQQYLKIHHNGNTSL